MDSRPCGNNDTPAAGRKDDPEQVCSDPAESAHEGCSPNIRASTQPPTRPRGFDLPARYLARDPDRWVILPTLTLDTFGQSRPRARWRVRCPPSPRGLRRSKGPPITPLLRGESRKASSPFSVGEFRRRSVLAACRTLLWMGLPSLGRSGTLPIVVWDGIFVCREGESLSRQALEVLAAAREGVRGGGLVFPGSRPGSMLGEKVMTQACIPRRGSSGWGPCGRRGSRPPAMASGRASRTGRASTTWTRCCRRSRWRTLRGPQRWPRTVAATGSRR